MSNTQALVDALEKISKPIVYLQNEAEKQGCKLDGVGAIQLANNANWLSSIATQALADYHKSQKEDWISVNDDLPKLNIEYNVAWEMADGDTTLVVTTMEFYVKKQKWIDVMNDGLVVEDNAVKFWRELPKPPIVAGSQTNSIDKK